MEDWGRFILVDYASLIRIAKLFQYDLSFMSGGVLFCYTPCFSNLYLVPAA